MTMTPQELQAHRDGKAAALRREAVGTSPHGPASPEHRAWVDGWNSQSNVTQKQSEAPSDEVVGLTAAELENVVGADDYEAGSDDVQPGSRSGA